MNQMQLLPPADSEEIFELTQKLDKAKEPSPGDVARLRKLASGMPDEFFTLLTPVREQLIGKMSGGRGMIQAFMLAETDRLKRDLGFTGAPLLEQLLIDHILTARQRLIHAEMTYNDTILNNAATIAVVTHRDKLLTSAQTRYLKAIESLAKVRRMMRNTPSLQINIAQDGGKQINVQGEAGGQESQ
jgi:hypothetical protein